MVSETPTTTLEEIIAELKNKYGNLELRRCPVYYYNESKHHFVPVGFHIVVEGLDGAGTTTVAQLLTQIFNRFFNRDIAIFTKEPSQNPIGFLLRSWLDGYLNIKSPESIALLFLADRIYHTYEKPFFRDIEGVVGLLDRGYIVVQDRYKYSHVVYQGATTIFSMEDLLSFNEIVPPAHILIYLDVDPEVAMQRILKSRVHTGKFEYLQKLEQIRNNYLELIKILRRKREWPTEDNRIPYWYILTRKKVTADVRCLYPDKAVPQPHIIVVNANRDLRQVLKDVTRELFKYIVEEVSYLQPSNDP